MKRQRMLLAFKRKKLKMVQWRLPLHATNLSLAQVLVQSTVKVLPPFKKHSLTNELEPWGKLEAIRLEHLFQVCRCNVLRVSYFIGVDVEVHVGLDEENVVDLVLAPLAITGGLVVYPCKELEFIQRNLSSLDAELVFQLPHRRALYAHDSSIQSGTSLAWNAQWVRAAGVGPHVGKSDLLSCSLLKE